MDPVAHDRSTDREAELSPFVRRVPKEWRVAGERFVSAVDEGSAVQLVATALGNRVHQSAGKVAITDVVRSKYDLVLLHRVDGDHLAVSDASHRTVTEQEALSHAIDQIAVETEAHAGS